MSDWKEKLRKSNLYKNGGPGMKRCKCGNIITNEKFNTCIECSKKKGGPKVFQIAM